MRSDLPVLVVSAATWVAVGSRAAKLSEVVLNAVAADSGRMLVAGVTLVVEVVPASEGTPVAGLVASVDTKTVASGRDAMNVVFPNDSLTVDVEGTVEF